MLPCFKPRIFFTTLFSFFCFTPFVYADDGYRTLDERRREYNEIPCHKKKLGERCAYISSLDKNWHEEHSPGLCKKRASGGTSLTCVSDGDWITDSSDSSIVDLLEKWRKAWQGTAGGGYPHMIEKFLSFYDTHHALTGLIHKKGSTQKQLAEKWARVREVKTYLGKRRKWIRIKLSDIGFRINFKDLSAEVTFEQRYQAPGYKEFSCKRLVFQRYEATKKTEKVFMQKFKSRFAWLITSESSCDKKMINSHQGRKLVRKWRTAWKKMAGGKRKDFTRYLAFYTPRYRKQYAQQLEQRFLEAKKSQYLRIYSSSPMITLQQKNRFTSLFFVRKVARDHQEYGMKTLTWIGTPESKGTKGKKPATLLWQIDDETWKRRKYRKIRARRKRHSRRRRTKKRNRKKQIKAPSKPEERKKTGAMLFPTTPRQSLSAHSLEQDNFLPSSDEDFFMVSLTSAPPDTPVRKDDVITVRKATQHRRRKDFYLGLFFLFLAFTQATFLHLRQLKQKTPSEKTHP